MRAWLDTLSSGVHCKARERNVPEANPTVRGTMNRLLALAPLCLLLTRSSLAAPSCPENVFGTCGIRRSTMAADRDSCSDCTSFACRTLVSQYDIPAGLLRASASSVGEGNFSTSLLVQDDFKVIGPAPGTPLSLTAHLSVNLTQTEAVMYDLRTGQNASANADPGPLTTDLTLDIATLADQDFRLGFGMQARVGPIGGVGYGEARLSFGGLPAGAVVISCNGYVGNNPVPTRQTSWGRLKQIYR